MSYAIVETGGKQYKVSEGGTYRVEKLDAAVGEQVTLERVMLLSNDGEVKVGAPTVDGARVVGKVTGQGRGKKIIVFKYKPKKRYRVKSGHRQPYTRLHIESIEG